MKHKKPFSTNQIGQWQHSPSILPCPLTTRDISLVKAHLLDNIATHNTIFTKIEADKIYISQPGAIIASPSRVNAQFSQDYFFHWIRDAAIVMNELAYLYEDSDNEVEREQLMQHFINYVYWNKIAQQQPPVNGINILGEPKYNIDGSVWYGEWSRPQNDGPALRAISLIHIAEIMLAQGKKEFITAHLFNRHLAQEKMGIIKNDLEYVANNWNYETAGLWEETYCYHFFTEAVQRRALISGATLAIQIGDHEAADYYLKQNKHLEELIRSHWNDSTGYYSETLQHHDIKGGGLNSAIILGIIYGHLHTTGDMLAVENAKIISTAYFIRYAFAGLYHINIKNDINCLGGPLIGRYADDAYDGNRSIYGNPWVLTSCILAKYYYMLARILLLQQKIEISSMTWPFYQQICFDMQLSPTMILYFNAERERFLQVIFHLLNAGDSILQVIKHHSISNGDGDDFHLAEQIDRSNGHQVSAKDLTWGYSTILSAYRSRQLLVKALSQEVKPNSSTHF